MNNPMLIPFLLIGSGLGLIVSFCSYILAPHIPLVWQISLTIGIACLLFFLVLSRSELGRALSKKTTRFGLNAALTCVVAFGIAVFVNLIANEYDLKKDLTKERIHSLEDQSIKVLKNLKDDINVKVFIDPNRKLDYQKLFGNFTYYTDKLKFQIVDLDRDMQLAQQYKVKQFGTLVFETPNRQTRVDNLTGSEDPKAEEKITNAIISVTKGDKKKIYFVSGHGERLPSDGTNEGFSQVKEAMEEGRYTVDVFPLLKAEKVPADAEILVWADPKTTIMPHEIKIVEDWLKAGGKAFLMVENDSTPSIQPFLASIGVDWKPRKLVVERSPLQMLSRSPFIIVVSNVNRGNALMKDVVIDDNHYVFLHQATTVEKAANASPDLKIDPIFTTSNVAVEVEPDKSMKVDLSKGRPGPLTLGLTVVGKVAAPPPAKDAKPEDAKKDGEFRVVVIGDANFGGNQGLRMGVNSDVFQNSLSWLSKEEDLISIRPKSTAHRELNITDQRAWIVHLASVYLLPLLMFSAAFTVWYTRKRK